MRKLKAQHAQAVQSLEAQHAQAVQSLEAQHAQAVAELQAQVPPAPRGPIATGVPMRKYSRIG